MSSGRSSRSSESCPPAGDAAPHPGTRRPSTGIDAALAVHAREGYLPGGCPVLAHGPRVRDRTEGADRLVLRHRAAAPAGEWRIEPEPRGERARALRDSP